MKNYILNYLLLSALLFGLGCESSIKETPSGLKYRLHREGVGETAKNRDFILLNIVYKDLEDSIWFSSEKEGTPLIIKRPMVVTYAYPALQHIFYDLRLGDSVSFESTVKQLYSGSFGRAIPEGHKGDEVLAFEVGVEAILNKTKLERWQAKQDEKKKDEMKKYFEQLHQDQVNKIDNYLDSLDVSYLKTESGLRYIINKEGNGSKLNEGDRMRINYLGKVLYGDFFDASDESLAFQYNVHSPVREYSPLLVTLGNREVINGWEEMLKLLKIGTSATIYIPSKLAYGGMSPSPKIPPYSILVFDIELIDPEK